MGAFAAGDLSQGHELVANLAQEAASLRETLNLAEGGLEAVKKDPQGSYTMA